MAAGPVLRCYHVSNNYQALSAVSCEAICQLLLKNSKWSYQFEWSRNSWLRVSSWVSQLLLAMNLCWQSTKIWCSSKWLELLLTAICSNSLKIPQWYVNETGLQFLAKNFFPFLNIGITLAWCLSVGTSPCVSEMLKMCAKRIANSVAYCWKMRADIWCGPVALLGS